MGDVSFQWLAPDKSQVVAFWTSPHFQLSLRASPHRTNCSNPTMKHGLAWPDQQHGALPAPRTGLLLLKNGRVGENNGLHIVYVIEIFLTLYGKDQVVKTQMCYPSSPNSNIHMHCPHRPPSNHLDSAGDPSCHSCNSH